MLRYVHRKDAKRVCEEDPVTVVDILELPAVENVCGEKLRLSGSVIRQDLLANC